MENIMGGNEVGKVRKIIEQINSLHNSKNLINPDGTINGETLTELKIGYGYLFTLYPDFGTKIDKIVEDKKAQNNWMFGQSVLPEDWRVDDPLLGGKIDAFRGVFDQVISDVK